MEKDTGGRARVETTKYRQRSHFLTWAVYSQECKPGGPALAAAHKLAPSRIQNPDTKFQVRDRGAPSFAWKLDH